MNIKHDDYVNEAIDYSTNLQQQMANDIQIIKNCVIYFTVLSTLGLIGSFLLLIFL